MADRYWVGGTGNWDGTNTTNWSATSGGAGGASIPTASDDVFFDANSGSGTTTIATVIATAKTLNCTGFTGTIAGSVTLRVSGDVTLDAGHSWTHTSQVQINASGTVTTAGQTFSTLNVTGAGITVTLGDAINTATRPIIVTNGTFDTAGYSVTANQIASSNSNTRTINLNSSTVTLASSNPFNVVNKTNLTFNAGTSQINLSNTNATLAGNGLTFYDVTFTSLLGATRNINGANTFNILNSICPVAHTIRFADDQTISIWKVSGSSGNVVTVDSSVAGTRRILTLLNATGNIDYLDVKDIEVSQPNLFYVGANSTDSGNNVNVIFTAAVPINVNAPLSTIAIAAQIPEISIGVALFVPVSNTVISALIPKISTGIRVLSPVSNISIGYYVPRIAAVVYNFEAVKEQYDRSRTVILTNAESLSRTITVDDTSRVVIISGTETLSRTVLVH